MSIRICLAPLRGISDALFRNTYARFFDGIDWAVTPFLTTTRGARIKPSQLAEVLPENNRRMPVTPQILSKTADHFIVLAEALHRLGYETVNWNLGCPYPMVAKKGRGSGLLHQPQVVEAFLERVVPNIRGRLSIKMRLGRFRTDEMERLLPLFNRFDLREIIIHPRTGIQMYEGKPDLAAFAQCLTLSQHTLVYNGDIIDLPSFSRVQGQFPSVKDWMIGRGAIVNPFLPGLIKGAHYDGEEAFRRFQQFHDALYHRYGQKLFGPSHLLNRMKGLWGYFSKAFYNGSVVRKKIHKTTKAIEYEAVVKRFFEEPPHWKDTQLGDEKETRSFE